MPNISITEKLKKDAMVFDAIALSEMSLTNDSSDVRTPPEEILLIKYGKTNYTKNGEVDSYDFAETDADKIINEFANRNRDLCIDYEHQSLSGDKAPAAGWIKELKKTADGLVGTVKFWTEEAKKFISSGEYRYSSPVLYISRRKPLSVHSLAITNTPATWGVPSLAGKEEINPSGQADAEDDININEEKNIVDKKTIVVNNDLEKLTKEKDIMDLKKFAEAIGIEVALSDKNEMDEAKTIESINAKIASLKASETEKSEFLKLHEVTDLGAMTLKVKGMVPASELTELNKKLAKIDAEKAVVKAFAEKKLVEAQRSWAMEYAEINPKGFSDFIAATPVVAPAPASEINIEAPKEEKKHIDLSDEALGKEFDNDQNIKAEFSDKRSYVAFRKAEADGKFKILKKEKSE